MVIDPTSQPQSGVDPSERKWQVRGADGQISGPFTLGELQTFIPLRRILPETLVRHPLLTINKWTEASQTVYLKSTFESVPAPTPAIPPSAIESPITEFASAQSSKPTRNSLKLAILIVVAIMAIMALMLGIAALQ